METLLKQPYEISLWDDRLTAVYEDGTETQEFADAQENIIAQYYKEFKICVIGSDTMDSPFKVVEPKLVRKTDGTSTLTFSIYTNCYNEETGEFETNPFVKYLTNERKVKLKYFPNGEMAWIDFIIKKIDETSENYKFTYTATDLFINELSKTGYNLEFDKELENGQGTVQQLAAEILSSSEWMVGTDSETIQQVNDEPIYAIELTSELEAYNIFDNTAKTIESGKTIYAFYSSVNNSDSDPSYFQFIYNENGIYNADENNIIYDVGNYYCNKNDVNGTSELYNGFRAEKYIRTQKSAYDKITEKYVNIYEKGGKKYYGYVDTKYFSPSLVTNYITNGESIISLSGWRQQNEQSIDITTYPPITQSSDSRIFGIKYVQGANNKFLVNSGFRDNAETIKEISLNQKFVFGIKGTILSENQKYRCRVCRFTRDNNGNYTLKDELFNTSGIAPIKLKDSNTYYFKNISPQYSLSYEELTDITSNRFEIYIDVINGNGEFFIEKAEFFQQFDGKAQGQPDRNGIVLPSGKILYEDDTISEEIAASQVINTYYYYEPNQNVSKIEEINYAHIGEQDDSFKKVYDYNFEKVRSISKKETNRFDLLQTLSETFECWCRFDVWHDEEGRILLGKDLDLVINGGDAFSKEKIVFLGGNSYTSEEVVFMNEGESIYSPYQQLKFVTFHKRIGQKKNVGFKYGINLKSISRSLDSNDIATKLIVKSNTNEFAEGGSCNIALAEENPSGENFVYDFSYYINKGLLNQDNLNNDLYYFESEKQEQKQRKWIGLYVKLKILNKQRDKLITEQVGLVSEYAKHKSAYESAKIQSNASLEELEDLRTEYKDITGSNYNGSITPEQEANEKINALVINIERLIKQDKDLKESFKKAKEEMDKVNERLEGLNTELKYIEQETSTLIKTFETKYVRFIQEASWTSEEYIDHNLYYLDAETTLHKSSQPKVSYTFNVIDLSRIEEYQDYSFDIGDITHVEDTEFFGWKYKDGVKTPRKEEIVVTEQTIFFDSPEKNTFKAQNYRTAFEDLFQRLTASSQQLQFHSGEFQRAADVVDANGNIAPSCLEDAFSNNAYLLSNAANQTVKWDEFGITTTDTKNPAEIVRITSGGMFLSENGGEKWTTGITAKGINAKTITAGVLNTGLVNIYNGTQKSFMWDSQGLNAYKQEKNGGYNINNFVRFNQFGLFGAEISSDKNFDAEENIKKNAKFYLGWDGLYLKQGIISMDDGTNRVLIDPFKKQDGDKIFEIVHNSKSIMSVNTSGNAKFSGEISANTGNIAGWTIGSQLIYKNKYNETKNITYSAAIRSGASIAFGVYEKSGNQGENIPHTSGENPWTGNFLVGYDGTLTAKKGTIGAWNVGTIPTNPTNWGSSSYTDSLYSESDYTLDGDSYKSLAFLRIPASATGHVFSIRTKQGNEAYKTPFYVTKSGHLFSSSGEIGGWTITDNYLKSEGTEDLITTDNKTTTHHIIFLRSASSTKYWIQAGRITRKTGEDPSYNFNFSVSKDGILNATGAKISEASIKDCTIDEDCTINGNISGASGTIGGWEIIDRITLKTYNTEEEFTVPALYSNYLDGTYYMHTYFTPSGIFAGPSESKDKLTTDLVRKSMYDLVRSSIS